MKITDEMLSAAAPLARDLLLDSLPPDDQIPAHTFSPEFEEKIQKLRRRYRWKQRGKRALVYLRKTVAVVLMVLGLSFAGLLTAAAAQGKFLDLFIHVYENYIVYESLSYPGRELEYTELYPVELGYIPDRMGRIHSYVSKEGDYFSIDLRPLDVIKEGSYRGPGVYQGELVELQQQLIRPGDNFMVAFTTEDAVHETFEFQGFTAEIYTKDGMTTLRWFDSNIYYELYGNIAVDELKKIAENIIFQK